MKIFTVVVLNFIPINSFMVCTWKGIKILFLYVSVDYSHLSLSLSLNLIIIYIVSAPEDVALAY